MYKKKDELRHAREESVGHDCEYDEKKKKEEEEKKRRTELESMKVKSDKFGSHRDKSPPISDQPIPEGSSVYPC